MQVDISFEFAKVYNINSADVVKGQKFQLLTDNESGRWFTDNDPVLALQVAGRNADVEATQIGQTTILILDDQFAIQKQLTINVVESIPMVASNLNAHAGEPVLK